MLDQLTSSLQDMDARSAIIGVIDILLVYYVIYRILLLIRGTKAVQMLVGILLVVVLFFASERDFLGLPTLNWMLDKFIASFIVIMVILFQDDIRRGLTQVGRTGRFTGLSQSEQTQFLEEIVKGSQLMSDRALGALVVIEREADLGDWMSDGVPIDAAVSKELLVSLFVPDRANPTHDGAVMIRKGRIATAGSFLPLTTNPRVDKTLGTRHRAALGLSETTDAVIVIVSEETGIISVAFRGELTRRLDGDELRALLQRLFSDSAPGNDDGAKRGFLARLRFTSKPRSASRDRDPDEDSLDDREPETDVPTSAESARTAIATSSAEG